MKRCIALLLVFAGCICLTSCLGYLKFTWDGLTKTTHENYVRTSLDQYAKQVRTQGFGHSSFEIDHPTYFLPTQTFLDDFPYVEGTYVWRLDGPLVDKKTSENLTDLFPEIALLVLTYEESVYREAKQYMLDRIPPCDDTRYTYGGYVFYENARFTERHAQLYTDRRSGVPFGFTMACYNDERNTLVFIGMEPLAGKGDCCLPDIYQIDIEHNWESFIDRYYGLYYDFGE